MIITMDFVQVRRLIDALTSLHARNFRMKSEDWIDKFKLKMDDEAMLNHMITVASQIVKMKPEWFEELFPKIRPQYTFENFITSVDSFKRLGGFLSHMIITCRRRHCCWHC